MAKKKAAKKNGKVKHCFKCGKSKPHSEFASNKSKSDGLATMCRSCYADYQADYRAKHAKPKVKKKAAPKKVKKVAPKKKPAKKAA